jgi:hypothetical protein
MLKLMGRFVGAGLLGAIRDQSPWRCRVFGIIVFAYAGFKHSFKSRP